MERNVAVHVLDKLVDMGLIKANQVNQTVITFVQNQIQDVLRDNRYELRAKQTP